MEVELTVDGEDIPMNNFVQKIIAGVVGGAAQSLEGVEGDWKDIEITVSR